MQSRIAVISFLEPGDPNYPNQGLPGVPGFPSTGFPPNVPGNALPGGPPAHPWLPGGGMPTRPDNGLPVGPPGSIGTLPVFPFDPSKPPVGPGSGGGETPGNELPGQPARPATGPIVVRPGLKLVVAYLCGYGFILVPDNELPSGPPPVVDNTTPGAAPKTK